jgi:hypothetical protein
MFTRHLRLFGITAPETQRLVYHHTLPSLEWTHLNLMRHLGLNPELTTNPKTFHLRWQKFTQTLMLTGLKSRDVAATYYDRAVKECKYHILLHDEVGDRVLLYHPQGAMEQGRTLRDPWLGPYRVVARQSSVGYTITSETNELVPRVHVNRLRKIADDTDLSDVHQPESGMPDTRLILRSILSRKETDHGTGHQVRRSGRNGFTWVPDTIPDVVRIAFTLAEKEGGIQ